jgi:hypothetical protein
MTILDQQQFQSAIQDPISEIIIASDGGVHNYHGNFGVVIACKSHSLLSNYGKLYSIEFYESSFRLEMYGVLVGLVTYHHMVKELETQMYPGKKINVYCDNKSVVNKISSQQELWRTVNQCHPDVNIEMQVLYEISLLETKGLSQFDT